MTILDMPFDLTNTPIVFQHLMNDVFHEYLDNLMVCYIDDIFIFSKNMKGHACGQLNSCYSCFNLLKLKKSVQERKENGTNSMTKNVS